MHFCWERAKKTSWPSLWRIKISASNSAHAAEALKVSQYFSFSSLFRCLRVLKETRVTNDLQMSKMGCILVINQLIFYWNLLKRLKLKAHSDSHSKSPYLPLFNQHVTSCSCCSSMHCATPSVDDVSLITMVSKLVEMQAGSPESSKNPEWNRLIWWYIG